MDIYAEITDRIIAELEAGTVPWEKPWTGTRSGAIRRSNGRPYSLLNQMILGKPGEYLTYKQCEAEGGRIKNGSRAKMVVFWKFVQHEKKDDHGAVIRDANGLPVTANIPFLRYYSVFHIDDCEGLSPKWNAPSESDPTIQPIERAQAALDAYIAREGISLQHEKSDEAFYSPARDVIHLPLMEQFSNSESYYDTAFHESVHSTGHPRRLNRISASSPSSSFGGESYSKEELVAEIGACAIMHELGIETTQTFRNNAAYIQSWLKALRNDKRMIVSAAGKAEKAVAMILNRSSTSDNQTYV